MLLKPELQKYCTQLKFNLGQAEKDYLQHLFLLFLSEEPEVNLIFKGGTALQKSYGLRRFSVDLDFTSTDKISSSALILSISKKMERFGYPNKLEEIKTPGETFVLKINGPLSGAGPMSVAKLQVEISQRESLLLTPQFRKINPPYKDLKSYTLKVMAEEEILAEKIRAIVTRNKPRDVFDLHFLLSRGVSFNLDFVNRKLAYYQEVFEKEKFIEKVKEKRMMWQKELEEYCSSVPEFEKVLVLIVEKIP